MAHLWARWLRNPCRLGDPHRFRAGGGAKSEVAHLWARWLRHPCHLGDPHRFITGGGAKSQVAHLWARWLRNPCRLGDPLCFRAGPLVGKVATSPLPSRGSPPLQSGGGGQNQKWPTCGQGGYVTPAISGIPTASERGGAKSEVAHLWARWLRNPCRLGDPLRFTAGGGKIRSGPLVGKVATSPLPSRGSPPLQSGGGAKSEVAHLWARWLRNPCRLGDPLRFRVGGQNQKWPTCGQGGYVTPAVSGIPTASERGGGQNQKWPTCGQGGYVTPAASGIPTASERGDKIRSGPLVGKVATSPLPPRGSPPLQSGGGKIRSGPQVVKNATEW